jgi:poly(hydroxyalkanoate) depolymerase family esterase
MPKARTISNTRLILGVFILSLISIPAQPAEVKAITDFGANPSGIGMYLYTPSNVSAKPAVLVNVHACHGKGTDVCGSSGAFAQQADKYGFLVICPSAVSSDGCWDVHSTNVLTHDGGGDASGIISMVKWVVQNKNGDANRVYIAGHSSGGMMTNVMLGSYPDVFKAGAAYAGVPFACYAQGDVDSLGWNTNCAQGKVMMTGKAWGDLVRAAFPTFAGIRPRIQIWHGTKDDLIYVQNFKEEIKQWTNVLGASETPTTTENGAPQPTWIRTRYVDGSGVIQVEAIEETADSHNLFVDAAEAVRFFGLDVPASPADAGIKDAAVDVRATGGADGNGGSGVGGQSGGAGGTGIGIGGAGSGGASGYAGAASGSKGGQTATAGNGSAGQAGNGSGGQPAMGGNSSGGRSAITGSGGRNADTGISSNAATGGTGSAGSGGQLGSGGQTSTAPTGGVAGSNSAGGQLGRGGTTKVTSTLGSIRNNPGKSGGCSIAVHPNMDPEFGIWLLAAFACTDRLRKAWRKLIGRRAGVVVGGASPHMHIGEIS